VKIFEKDEKKNNKDEETDVLSDGSLEENP
jgi:hypothetical protein